MSDNREKYDPTRCQECVSTYVGSWPHHHQCTRKHLPDSPFCKQHLPKNVEARLKTANERGAIAWRARMIEFYGKRFYDALKKIAAGDNDPRSTAIEALSVLKEPP